MNGYGQDSGLPIENFIQALTSQLDRAQAALALKARAGLPLTFAVKDLTIDLRAQMEMVGSVVHIRPAGPSEPEASTVRLQLTTVTRPMIEENAVPLTAAPDEPTLREVLGPDVTEDEQRRLEWAGIHNVAQLRELQRRSGEDELERFTRVPVMRLRAALERASRPRITHVAEEPLPPPPPDGNGRPPHKIALDPLRNFARRVEATEPAPVRFDPGAISAPPSSIAQPAAPSIAQPAPSLEPAVTPPVLRIRGINLVRDIAPKVSIRGETVPVLSATEKEIVVAPHAHLLSGTLAVEVAPGVVAETEWKGGTP